MKIEPIGLVTIAIGLICLALDYRAAAVIFVVSTLFGSAAAILIGSANIQPAHLFLAFITAVALTRSREIVATFKAITPPQPGFWLACLLFYGLISAYVLPRLLAGGTEIVPLGTSEYPDTGSTVPLGPVSSNLTQSIYMTADVLCFAMIVAIASTRDGFDAITRALIAYAAANVFFAALDLVTYNTGTQAVLEFMRNAQYTLHNEEEINGLKRIVGSFTEASAFARSALGAFAFTGTLWLCGRHSAWTGPLALASFLLVVLSTSSTGLAGAPVVLMLLFMTAMQYSLRHGRSQSGATILLGPPLAVIAVLLLLVNSDALATVLDYVNVVVLNKSNTSSGIERASWNTTGLQNFFDSWGFGVGLGTSRTSGQVFALLSNVGVLGTLFYCMFLLSAFVKRRGTPGSYPTDVRIAARNACIGLFVGDLLVSSTVDQGLFFYILAGLASAEPERNTHDAEAYA